MRFRARSRRATRAPSIRSPGKTCPKSTATGCARTISQTAPAEWMFEGATNWKAKGWDSGECKKRPDDIEPDPLAPANLRAIRTGGQFADMVALVAAAARSTPQPATVAELRAQVVTSSRAPTQRDKAPSRASTTTGRFASRRGRRRARPSSSSSFPDCRARSSRRCSTCACATNPCARSTRSSSTST